MIDNIITTKEKKEKILSKIKNLLNKTVENGCTETEALSASEMIGRLMSSYDINMSEIEFKNEDFLTINIDTVSKNATYGHNLIMAIAYFTDTKTWFSRNGNIKYHFFGSDKDVKIAEYLFHLLKNSMKFEIEKFKKSTIYKNNPSNGKSKVTAFMNGMTIRLNQRLREMKDELLQNENNETGIVLFNKKSIVETKFKQTNVKLSTSRAKITVRDSSSYNYGKEVGSKIDIRAGLGGTKNKSNVKVLN